MKKKGLIISTVVMVVVLIASLTTATYAWFTQTSTVTVDSINFGVKAGADLVIGLSKSNNFVDTPTQASFCSGETKYTPGATFDLQGGWDSDVSALASNIDLNGLSFSGIKKAVGTGTFTGTAGATYDSNTNSIKDGTALNGTADDSFNNTNYKTGMIKAEGQATSVQADTVDRAWKQFDYLDVVIGVQAAKANLTSMTCYVTVNPSVASIIGMNAAIHVAYEVVKPGAKTTNTLTDKDVYEGYTFGTTPNNVTNTVYINAKTAYDTAKKLESKGMTCLGGDETALNQGAITLPITLDTNADGIDVNGIYQLHLVIYIAGFDGDCLEAAKGVDSTIYITFAGVEKAA